MPKGFTVPFERATSDLKENNYSITFILRKSIPVILRFAAGLPDLTFLDNLVGQSPLSW
jgi:hypothetical protein